jgi:hypothetical protein
MDRIDVDVIEDYDYNNHDNSATETTTIIKDNDPKLAELIRNVSKIIKEARHNDLMYPELAEISTYRDLNIWIHKHYRLFYSVFQTDLLCVMASIPKHHL